jgi:hypothetical protein
VNYSKRGKPKPVGAYRADFAPDNSHDCPLLDRIIFPNDDMHLKRAKVKYFFMEEQYKGHIIRVTAEKNNSTFPWKPICRIMDGTSREFIKQLDWQIGYETADQAKKVGLLISKKWIDAGKPNL